MFKTCYVFMLAFFTLTTFQTACVEEETPIDTNNTKLLLNGNFYTVNPAQPWATAMYIENGKIKFIGDNVGAEAIAAESAEVIDLEEAMVLPGIHDVHMHPIEAKSTLAGTCLLNFEVETAEDYIPYLQACAPDQIGTDWVLGWGYRVADLLESEEFPVDILDEAIPDQPAIMMGETSHSVWVNSKALEMANIDKNTPNPTGGVIVKDPITGEPTGLLFDAAGDFMMDLAWTATTEIKNLNYQSLQAALKDLNANGITSVCEARTYWRRAFEEAWFRAKDNGSLTVRASLGLWAYPHLNDEEQIAKLTTLYENQDDLLKVNQIKVYSDGILVNSTAAMVEPYLETLGAIPSNDGLNYFAEPRLTKYIQELDPIGFDFHIHAIGDRGVRESLNAIEAAQQQGRHRITHVEVVKESDLSRFKSLNVTADCQVSGEFAHPDHWHENDFLVGSERASNLIPLKSLEAAGARITLSSDWDVSELNPFVGMEQALTRNPQQLSSLAKVIEAYTINGAYVMRQEDKTGSLEVGKYADLVVIDQNLFDISPSRIDDTQVIMTFLEGRIVYEQ